MFKRPPIREYFRPHIPDATQLDAFGLWAFGEFFDEKSPMRLMEEWNERHSDQLALEESSIIEDDAPKMIKLWRDSLTHRMLA